MPRATGKPAFVGFGMAFSHPHRRICFVPQKQYTAQHIVIVYRTALILVLPKFNIEGIEGIEGICICADDATDYGGQTGSETSSEKGSEKTATRIL